MTRTWTRLGFTLVELIVTIAIIAVLFGLTLAAVQQIRATAARAQCANNLRQIGLALSNYEAAHKKFPAGMSVNKPGDQSFPYLSWHAWILPYVEKDSILDRAISAYRTVPSDFTASPPHPFDTVIPVYGCPADGRVQTAGMARGKFPAAFTSYLGVSGNFSFKRNGVLFKNSATRIANIRDGTSNTLMVGERPPSGDLWEGWWYAGYGCDGSGRGDMVLGARDGSGGCIWDLTQCPGKPAGFRRGKIENNCDALHFWSLHPGGANFLFCDGSVHFLSYSADKILPALATRAGREAVSFSD